MPNFDPSGILGRGSYRYFLIRGSWSFKRAKPSKRSHEPSQTPCSPETCSSISLNRTLHNIMDTLALSREQIDLVNLPFSGSLFLGGPAGAKKPPPPWPAMTHVERGHSSRDHLAAGASATLLLPIFRRRSRPRCPPGGSATLMTRGGLARRVIALFWPLIAGQAGFKRPERPPFF